MGRSPCCDKTGLNKGPWTPAEDLRLITFIHKYGHANWRALPKQAGLLRCGKSCRLRWTNYLRPDIKRGNFTEEEEETIIKLQQTLGNKWSKIASELPGRTDNEIKNVWNTHLKKRLLSRGQAGEEEKSSSPSSSADSSTSSCISQGMKATSPKGPISALSDEHFLDGSMNGTQVTDIKTGFELNGTERVLLDKSKGKELSSSSYSTASSPYLPNFSYKEQNDHQQEFNLGEVYDQDSLVKELLKEKDPDEDMFEIPFEVPNMDFLDLLDNTKPTNKSSLCESFEVHQHTADYMEKESESQRWLTYLENELGLEETNDDVNKQKIQKNDTENAKQTAIDGSGGSGQIDPVSIYFQMWPSESLLQNF